MAKAKPRAGELTTANYGWTKPTVGASDDAWGGYINANLDGIDNVVHGIQTSIPAVPAASTTPPAMDGTASAGSSAAYARGDHVHPTDTTRAAASALASYMPIAGVTDGSNAAAGQIGEYINAFVPSTSQVVVTNAAAHDITSISLTPGDWDVDGFVGIIAGGGVAGAGVTIGQCYGWINTVSASIGGFSFQAYGGAANINVGHAIVPSRISVTATTIVYLSFLAAFTGGNSQVGGFGIIRARRVR